MGSIPPSPFFAYEHAFANGPPRWDRYCRSCIRSSLPRRRLGYAHRRPHTSRLPRLRSPHRSNLYKLTHDNLLACFSVHLAAFARL